MHHEDRRAARLARIRAERDTPERLEAIERHEAEKQAARKPRRSTTSSRKTPENSDDYYGLLWPDWFRFVAAGHTFLVQCAKDRRTTTYDEVWTDAVTRTGLEPTNRRRATPQFMGYIAMVDVAESDLILTALVLGDGPDGQRPERGFFRLGVNQLLLNAADAPPDGEGADWTMTDRQRAFWEDQVEKLFAFYGEG